MSFKEIAIVVLVALSILTYGGFVCWRSIKCSQKHGNYVRTPFGFTCIEQK